ncbi:MAG: CRISPR-associated endonuclease Cas1 [Candidatus Sericytochromatia bacterium]|nr:CRISPR-associated endonuclease Cas1 [Candidatus Tanganyikabacteria bacterium]
MTVLYITEQGATVGRRSERLIIQKRGQEIDQVRLADLEQVVLLGHVQMSSAAVRALLARGVDLALLSAGGAYLGRLSRGASRNIDLRRIQFRRLDDEPFALDLAKRFVRGKLVNLRTHLGRHQRTHPDDVCARSLVAIRVCLERIDGAEDLDALLGFEGRASAAYFEAFGRQLRAEGMIFTRRLRRPPPDPVNILLSFGYTLLTTVMQGYCELAGFDPFLGALHRPEYGRPSLALDLIEEFRPLAVDMPVVRAVNTRAITPADFVALAPDDSPIEDEWEREECDGPEAEPPRRRIVFTPGGVKKWLTAFERRLAESAVYPPTGQRLTYRQIMREQVYRLARHLKGEGEYEPFEVGA